MKVAILLFVFNFSIISIAFEAAQRWAYERIHGKRPPVEQPIRAIDGRTGQYVIID